MVRCASVCAASALLCLLQPRADGQSPQKKQQLTIQGSAEVTDPSWGFGFTPPAGWRTQKDAGGAVLGHDKISGMILVLRHEAGNLPDMEQQMQNGLSEEGTVLTLSGELAAAGRNTRAGDYAGIYQGEEVRAHCVGRLSPHGGGAYVLALSPPASYTRDLGRAADLIARSLTFQIPAPGDLPGAGLGSDRSLTQWITGSYYSFTDAGVAAGGTERRLILCGNGRFRFRSESGYSGGGENVWGAASQGGEEGRWIITGDRLQGTITLSYSDGRQEVVDYTAGAERGCFLFAGIQYCYEGPAECR